MFLLLTQILLWLLITIMLYKLFKDIIPKEYFTLIGALFLFAVIVMGFFLPSNQLVSSIWNVLSFPLKPVGACILLLGFAIRNDLAKSKNQVLAALLILLLSSTPLFSNLLAQGAEQRAFTPQEAGTRSAAAIVLIGQGTTQPNIPPRTQIQLTDTGDRILYTAQLYQQSGNDPLVIVSAGPRPNFQGSKEPIIEGNDIRTLLIQLGVPESRIVVDTKSTDLRGSAEASEKILRERGLANQQVFVVNSAVNSNRTRQTFKDVGLTNTIAKPTGFFRFQSGATSNNQKTTPQFNFQVDSLIPSVEALGVTTRVFEEFLSSIYYYLRGWLAPSIF
jgi:uncharacterized SAM-binding protein YcdF (DUF218 family)